jgi:hypothetical protein
MVGQRILLQDVETVDLIEIYTGGFVQVRR